MSAEKYYSGNNTQAPPSQAQNYAPPQGPPPTHDQRGFNDYNQGQPQGQQGYYQQGPPQYGGQGQPQQYGGQQGGYYQQGPPQGQQGYYQQQQPVYVQQKPPRDNSQDCCMACLAALCICCTLDAIF